MDRTSLILSIALIIGCAQQEGSEQESASAAQIEQAIDLQTDHPYANFTNLEYDVNAPANAERITIQFDRFETENGYDFVEILDGDGQRAHRLSGNHDGEAFVVEGNTARILFRSDFSVTAFGFIVTHFYYEVEDNRPTDHRPFCDAIGSRSEGWYWGDTGELIKYERCADMPEPECGAIGSRSEGWYIPDQGRIVWDSCHRTVRIALAGEYCGPSIGFSCYDDLYCHGVPQNRIGGRGVCKQNGYCEAVSDCNLDDNGWIHPMCMGYASCETNRCIWHCGAQPMGKWSWTTYMLQNIESPHPYPNNYNETWQVSHPGAEKMKVLFEKIDTERGYDHLVLSGNREEIAHMVDGTHTDYWSPELSGDQVNINLQSDYSVTKYGFEATSVSAWEQLAAGACNRVEDCETGEFCHASRCLSPYAPCYGTCMVDNHCDDGSQLTCRMMIPNCPEGQMVAIQNGCYECVDPETCAPVSTGGEGDPCNASSTCDSGLECKHILNGQGTCQDQLWCSTDTVDADCARLVHPAIPGSWTCPASACVWTPGLTYTTIHASDTPLGIPDNDPNGIASVITVNGMAARGCGVAVSVEIDHTWRSDLRVVLTRPNNTEVVLHNRTGGSDNDLVIVEEDVSATGVDAGDWRLHVSDNASADTGTLLTWSLVVDCS